MLTLEMSRKRHSTSPGPYPGVRRRKRRYEARISIAGEWVRLGLYRSDCEAVRAQRDMRAMLEEEFGDDVTVAQAREFVRRWKRHAEESGFE